MHKKVLAGVVLLALLTMLLAACSIHANTGPSGPTVHMGGADFLVPSISISKGDSITLIDDTSQPHSVVNGTWSNGVAKPAKESGAPTVNANFVGGDNASIGPFSTSGTFKLYCTVHPGMNLTVIVN